MRESTPSLGLRELNMGKIKRVPLSPRVSDRVRANRLRDERNARMRSRGAKMDAFLARSRTTPSYHAQPVPRTRPVRETAQVASYKVATGSSSSDEESSDSSEAEVSESGSRDSASSEAFEFSEDPGPDSFDSVYPRNGKKVCVKSLK